MTVHNWYALSEIPTFVKGGAVVAREPLAHVRAHPVGRSAQGYQALEFSVYPTTTWPDSSHSTSVYEDDGATTAYSHDATAWGTTTAQTRSYAASTVINITSTNTATSGAPAVRAYSVRMLGCNPPAAVTCGGKTLPYSRWGGAGTWSYDGDALAVVVECAPASTAEGMVVHVDAGDSDMQVPQALQAVVGMTRRANMAKVPLDHTRETPGAHTIGTGYALKRLSAVPQALEYLAGQPGACDSNSAFAAELRNAPGLYAVAQTEVQNMKAKSEVRKGYSIKLMTTSA
jgi:hypothetical protein